MASPLFQRSPRPSGDAIPPTVSDALEPPPSAVSDDDRGATPSSAGGRPGDGGEPPVVARKPLPPMATLGAILEMAGLGVGGLASGASPEEQPMGEEDGDNSERGLVASAFEQVLRVIAGLQAKVQESELHISDLQASADELEEKRRALVRQAERAERERDAAAEQLEVAEAAAKSARTAAAPAVQRFMEAEVLRNQLRVLGDELLRLREEAAHCKGEIERGFPAVEEAEEAEAEVQEAIAELEASHAEEMALLESVHTKELGEIHAQHAAAIAELEAARDEEVARLEAGGAEELRSLRAALESARWEADVYRREQQDLVRETCLRQRENARLRKQHAEAKQEIGELTVRLEALRAEEAGAAPRHAEIMAVRRRHALLQQTAAEWSQALERKRADCDAWRRWAVQRGASMLGVEEEEPEDGDASYSATPAAKAPRSLADALGPDVVLGRAVAGSASSARGDGGFSDDASSVGGDAARSKVAATLSLTSMPPVSPQPPILLGADGSTSEAMWEEISALSAVHSPEADRSSLTGSWAAVPTPARTSAAGAALAAASRNRPSSAAPLRERNHVAGGGGLDAWHSQSASSAATGPRRNARHAALLAEPPALPNAPPSRSSAAPSRGVPQRGAAAAPTGRGRPHALEDLSRRTTPAGSYAPPTASFLEYDDALDEDSDVFLAALGVNPGRRRGAPPARASIAQEPRAAAAAASRRGPGGLGAAGAILGMAGVGDSASEFLGAVMRAAQLEAEAQSAAGRFGGRAEDGAGPPGGGEEAAGGGSSVAAGAGAASSGASQRLVAQGVDPKSELGSALVEATNEVEMLTFLLDDADAEEAASLLNEEAERQERRQRQGDGAAAAAAAIVARRLRSQAAELLASRSGRSASDSGLFALAVA